MLGSGCWLNGCYFVSALCRCQMNAVCQINVLCFRHIIYMYLGQCSTAFLDALAMLLCILPNSSGAQSLLFAYPHPIICAFLILHVCSYVIMCSFFHCNNGPPTILQHRLHYMQHQVTARGRNSDRIYTLKYEDGEVETIDLATERFRFLGGAKRPATASNDQSKRRRINDDEDSDEEFEFDDEVSDDDDDDEGAANVGKANRRPSMSDGSEFLASENDGDDDEDDSEEEFEFDEDDDDDLEDSEEEEALMVTGELSLYQAIGACVLGEGIGTSWIERAHIHVTYYLQFCSHYLSSLNENQTRTRRTVDMEHPAARRRTRSRPVAVVPRKRRRSR